MGLTDFLKPIIWRSLSYDEEEKWLELSTLGEMLEHR